MKTKILVALLILTILSACNSDFLESPDPEWYSTIVTFRIKGTITDSIDNSPVSGAFVTLGLNAAIYTGVFTNIKGEYTIEYQVSWSSGHAESNLTLSIKAEGYKEKMIRNGNDGQPRLTEEWQIIDVQLESLN